MDSSDNGSDYEFYSGNFNGSGGNSKVVEKLSEVLYNYFKLLPAFREQFDSINFKKLSDSDLAQYTQVRLDFNALIFKIDELLITVRPSLNILKQSIQSRNEEKTLRFAKKLMELLDNFSFSDLKERIFALIQNMTTLDIKVQHLQETIENQVEYVRTIENSFSRTVTANGFYLIAAAYMTKLSALFLSSVIGYVILTKASVNQQEKNESKAKLIKALDNISFQLNINILNLKILTTDINNLEIVINEIRSQLEDGYNDADYSYEQLQNDIIRLTHVFDALDDHVRQFGYYYDKNVISRHNSR